jgi:hypothetical protein
MLEKETVVAQPQSKSQVSQAKSLVYLSVSLSKKQPRSQTAQYVKITSRLLSQKAK